MDSHGVLDEFASEWASTESEKSKMPANRLFFVGSLAPQVP
jgi:hypothetical protein